MIRTAAPSPMMFAGNHLTAVSSQPFVILIINTDHVGPPVDRCTDAGRGQGDCGDLV